MYLDPLFVSIRIVRNIGAAERKAGFEHVKW